MYWVVNITKPPQTIGIGDLNIVIGARKAMDLEKILPRHKIEESKDLKRAVKSKMLQVRHEAKSNKKKEQPVSPQSSTLNAKELNKIRSTVRDEIQSLMEGQSQPELLQAVNNLLEVTKNLKDAPPQKVVVEHSGSPGIVEPQDIDEVDEIDEDKLADIHAKSIKNKTQNAETQLTYEERKGDSSVAANASELDDLLA
jgi:hypothetical protein